MEIQVNLPILHPDQVAAWNVPSNRRKVIRCGRRWGKTKMAECIAADGAGRGELVGYFTPTYKYQSEVYRDLIGILDPITKSSSTTEGIIRTISDGRIDFWTLENENAGRSRRYHKVIIDEAAFTKPNMLEIWERSIEPTLLDFQGSVFVFSNTNGVDPDNFMYQICNDAKHGFTEYHAPTFKNPFLPLRREGESEEAHQVRRNAEFARIKATRPPLVFQQEYLAEFVDWSGVAFFELQRMYVNGAPIAYPKICDTVFAVIDSATKTGKEHDGTGVSYFARSQHGGTPLILLDWDYVQIEGHLLSTWLPSVLNRLNELANDCGARFGSSGIHIEDKSSGMILIQHATAKGLPVHAINSKLTAVGKSERAISVSGFVYNGMFKLSSYAVDKLVEYKGALRNHWLLQVLGFRVGDDDKNKADDLLDTMTYGLALALGDSTGF